MRYSRILLHFRNVRERLGIPTVAILGDQNRRPVYRFLWATGDVYALYDNLATIYRIFRM